MAGLGDLVGRRHVRELFAAVLFNELEPTSGLDSGKVRTPSNDGQFVSGQRKPGGEQPPDASGTDYTNSHPTPQQPGALMLRCNIALPAFSLKLEELLVQNAEKYQVPSTTGGRRVRIHAERPRHLRIFRRRKALREAMNSMNWSGIEPDVAGPTPVRET
jgi:hypothetical protein